MFVTYKDIYIPISMGFLKTRRDWDDIFNAINQIKLLMKYIIHRKTALHIWKRDEDIPRPKKKKREFITITSALEKIWKQSFKYLLNKVNLYHESMWKIQHTGNIVKSKH